MMNKKKCFIFLAVLATIAACSQPTESEGEENGGGTTTMESETLITFNQESPLQASLFKGILPKVSGKIECEVGLLSYTASLISGGTIDVIADEQLNGVSSYSFELEPPYKQASKALVLSVVNADFETQRDTLSIEMEAYNASGELKAFPSAEGHGAYTSGGRGGKVIYVTNLNDSGTGSLRAAITATGPRIIAFKVAGTIRLQSPLAIANGDVTIAGQTAPGDGICLRDYPVTVNADNVIIRYMRFRMGDKAQQEADALGGRFYKNIIVDHCSMSWSTDECVTFYANENLTLQWCIITESLANSVHGKGSHGYGGVWGGTKASFHHNLLSSHGSRTPRFGDIPEDPDGYNLSDLVDVRNNVYYNYSGQGCYGGEGMNINIVNNYYKPGPATSSSLSTRIAQLGPYTNKTSSPIFGKWGRYYIDGNFVHGHAKVYEDNWTYGVYNHFWRTLVPGGEFAYLNTEESRRAMRLDAPLNAGEVSTHSAEQAYDLVLAYAGMSLKRDAVDARAVSDCKTGTVTFTDGGNGSKNGIIDTQDAVGAWPELRFSESEVKKDTDSDGMPDDWEKANGLNPNDHKDAYQTTIDGKYTNVEVYLNSIVKTIADKQNGEDK